MKDRTDRISRLLARVYEGDALADALAIEAGTWPQTPPTAMSDASDLLALVALDRDVQRSIAQKSLRELCAALEAFLLDARFATILDADT